MRTLLIAATVLFLLAPSAMAEDPEPIPDSGDIAPGETYSHTFTEVYVNGHHYHCHPHPWMWAMVHVNADTDGETTTRHVDIVEGNNSDDWGYSEQHLSIEVGDTVVWTNTGDLVHTVSPGNPDDDGTGHHHDDGHHDEHHGDENGIPGVGVIAALGAVLAAGFLRRK